MKNKHILSQIKGYLNFPHIQVFIILVVLATFSIILSIYICNQFWASFFSNISAGLFTGLVICLVSGFKNTYKDRLEEKKSWLEGLNATIMDYNNMRSKYIYNAYDTENEYDFVYDMGAKASWVNDYILFSHKNKDIHFNSEELCKNKFEYDANKCMNECSNLRDRIIEDNWSKKEVFEMFRSVDKQIRSLNYGTLQEIESIKLLISKCNNSII